MTKTQSIYLLVVIAAFIIGRYSAPEKVTIDKESHSVEKQDNKENLSHADTRVVLEVSKPDGTKIVKTTVSNKTRVIQKSKSTSDVNLRDQTVIQNRTGVVVSVLMGAPLQSLTSGIVYGASFSKQILGPLCVGAFGFTDFRVGVSLGLQL